MPSTPLCFLAALCWRSVSRHACANPQYQTFRRVHKGAHEAEGLVRGGHPLFFGCVASKGFREREIVCVAGKGVTDGFCAPRLRSAFKYVAGKGLSDRSPVRRQQDAGATSAKKFDSRCSPKIHVLCPGASRARGFVVMTTDFTEPGNQPKLAGRTKIGLCSRTCPHRSQMFRIGARVITASVKGPAMSLPGD
jgi:hypothetical protein